MLSARKTWDLGHSPSLQELWKKDTSLDASAIDFLMSDVEEDTSFLPLQTSSLPRRLVTSDLPDPSNQQLLIQALQDKVCEFQARLCGEDPSRRQSSHEPQAEDGVTVVLSLQDVSQQEEEAPQPGPQPAGLGSTPVIRQAELRLAQPANAPREEPEQAQEQEPLRSQDTEQHILIGQLRMQVRDLEEKLLNQSQEMERLRSELGATDLEKQLKVLMLENEHLQKELTSHQHSRLNMDVETLQGQVAVHAERRQAQELRAEELQRRLGEEEARAEQLQQRLEQVLREREELELHMGQRLRDYQETLMRQASLPPEVKYVTQTVEVESAQSQRALQEVRTRNKALQEQLEVQQELLHELEQQLHESQRVSSQLRVQILAYEAELERCRGQLEDEMQSLEEEKNRIIEEAFIRAESEMKAVHKNLAGVQMNLATLQPALRTLTCDYNCLKRQVQEFPFMLEKAITEAKREICHVIAEVSGANQELLRKYKREMNLRKRYHDELVRLKGNIRVFCRVRPVCQEEFDSGESRSIVTFDPDDDAIVCLANKGKPMTFELDKVFLPQATQEEVFKEVQSLITSCIDGYNVCIFAYGQTGSGKTYTMEGTEDNPGINQRALRLLFDEVSEKAPDWEFRITVSMVEIYNETLRNLLGENSSEKLEVKMCPDGRGQLYVPGLTEIRVQSVDDINKVFNLGYLNRATACTNLNEHSSRSHALLIVTVTGVNTTTGHRTSGKLNLVDLAGSERISRSGAEGSRLREAQCINKSLSALGDVIHALRSRQPHVPFRNSRLTYLLQDSLSGDSKTLMMVQVSPLEGNVSESMCSLKFAQRVRSVELGSAAARKPTDSPPTAASPVHDSLELDSPPTTPVSIPLTRVSSTGSIMPSSIRRKSHNHLPSGRPGRMKIPA